MRDMNFLAQRTAFPYWVCLQNHTSSLWAIVIHILPHDEGTAIACICFKMILISCLPYITIFRCVWLSCWQIGYLLKVKLSNACVYDFCVCILCNLNSFTSKRSNKMECKKPVWVEYWVLKTPLEFRNNPCLITVEPSVSNLQFDL